MSEFWNLSLVIYFKEKPCSREIIESVLVSQLSYLKSFSTLQHFLSNFLHIVYTKMGTLHLYKLLLSLSYPPNATLNVQILSMDRKNNSI